MERNLFYSAKHTHIIESMPQAVDQIRLPLKVIDYWTVDQLL